MTLRILHTADTHLDAPFGFLGHKGAAHRHQIRETFSRIIKLAATDHYDMLLIAGDLFNDNHPARTTQHFVTNELQKLAVPVCILPGNHDPLDRNSVYDTLELPANVHVLKDRPHYIDFAGLDLTVAGNPIHSRYDSTSQLAGIARQESRRRESRRWFVAMAHGSMQRAGVTESGSRPIPPGTIAATGADYVALGDWHAFADYSENGVKTFYSGAPEPTTLAQERTGNVASITLSDQGVTVEPIRVGAVEARKLELNITGLTETEIIRTIQAEANAQRMLSVRLSGLKWVDRLIDQEAIREALASQFYWLQIQDGAVLDPQKIDPAEYPEDFVIGQYARLLAARIEQATNERDRSIAEQALQLGVALLNGHKVL